jgi:hypothetical protein
VRPSGGYGRRMAASSLIPPVMTAMSEVCPEELLRASSCVVRYVPSMTGNLEEFNKRESREGNRLFTELLAVK